MEQFFKIPIGITEDIVQELADGLESLFQDYMMFVTTCGKYCFFYQQEKINKCEPLHN